MILAFKINIAVEAIMIFIYILCFRNNGDYIYDSMLLGEEID